MKTNIEELIIKEQERQQETLSLIPSENYASPDVLEAVGSILSNKYAEGYPGRRYYEGNEIVDQIEQLAIDKTKAIFAVPHVNVQPYSGSPANAAIYFALCEMGDTIMGLSLGEGGHLTHGHPKVTFSGKFFNSVQFGLNKEARIDYDLLQKQAIEVKPKVIILGTTAYPFILDFKRAREIADSVGAYLVADISHIVGLIIAGVHPSPVPYAHVIMTTTHKTLRGPRGAMILVTESGIQKNPDLPKKIDAAVFPGLQGGPHMNQIAGLVIALDEAMTPAFTSYGKQVVANAKHLATCLMDKRIALVGNGTENHLMVMDFSGDSVGKGTLVARAMAYTGLIANRNTVPGDPSPFYPSGVRIGTPAVTTRGLKEKEMEQIADWIVKIVDHIQDEKLPQEPKLRAGFVREFSSKMQSDKTIAAIREEVRALCKQYPMP